MAQCVSYPPKQDTENEKRKGKMTMKGHSVEETLAYLIYSWDTKDVNELVEYLNEMESTKAVDLQEIPTTNFPDEIEPSEFCLPIYARDGKGRYARAPRYDAQGHDQWTVVHESELLEEING
jgi:hypothetical protein